MIGAPAHHARARSYSQADAHEPSLRTVLEEPRGANGGTTTEEEKRERRMQANRLSAAKSRMKKMRRMVELEQTCEETLTRVNALSAEVEALRAEYEELRARNEELTSTLSTPRGPHLDSASKEFLQSLSGVDGSFTGMTIDAKGYRRRGFRRNVEHRARELDGAPLRQRRLFRLVAAHGRMRKDRDPFLKRSFDRKLVCNSHLEHHR